MCVSVHGFSWVSHGCNRPWLYVGADRIVSSRVWHGLTSFFFTGPCRSIESQQDCEEHRLVMESDWQWRSRGLVAFGLFTFRYVKVNFSQNKDSILLDTCMEYFSSFTSCRKPPSLPLPSCFHPMSEIRGRSTGPRAEHLSNTTSVLKSRTSIVHHDSICVTPFRNLEPLTPVPNTRLLPLQGRCNSMTSWCSSCWLSMLRQGPEDDKDGKPFQAWEFTMRSATIIYSHVHHQTFEAKITSRSQC